MRRRPVSAPESGRPSASGISAPADGAAPRMKARRPGLVPAYRVVRNPAPGRAYFLPCSTVRQPRRSRFRHNMSMDTRTIERTDTDERVDDGTGSDTPKYFHYVKKDKIAESAVMGSHVVALCGEVFPVTRAAKPGSPVCPECKRIYETLKKS